MLSGKPAPHIDLGSAKMPSIRENWFEVERLHRAAQEGDIQEMSALVSAGYKLNEFDELSKTPLHYAVEGEHYKAVQWLLESGAEVDAHQEELIGETALCQAARQSYPEMVELLLKEGADPDIPGWMQISARIRAQGRKDEEGRKIAALIEKHKPSKTDPGGRR
jgi:ankyrin repeat protein